MRVCWSSTHEVVQSLLKDDQWFTEFVFSILPGIASSCLYLSIVYLVLRVLYTYIVHTCMCVHVMLQCYMSIVRFESSKKATFWNPPPP